MKKFTILCGIILLCGGIVNASDKNLNDTTFNLITKKGKHIPYLLKKDEIAVTGGKNFLPKNITIKKIFQHPSYTLFAIERKDSIRTMTNHHSNENNGLVFYKYSQKNSANRYISTGTILITFDKNRSTDIEHFAKENHLKYLKTISNTNQLIILFSNESKKNDIELSSALIKDLQVISAKPNWILPLKLF